LIPLKDNIPTGRFPIITVLLIAVNVAVFAWQLTFSTDHYSNQELRDLNVPERDENTLEYGAIPYRLTHPGEDCAVGTVVNQGGARPEVVCEGTSDYAMAEQIAGPNAPFAPLDSPPWWATVLTSMFMHGGILHIAFNMLFLWVFGNNVEDSMGRGRYVLFYLLAGAAAVYAQALLDTSATVPTIGASGAVAGVLGGYLLLYPHARVLTLVFIIFFVTLIEIPALVMLGIWFMLQFVPAIGQLATPDVSATGGGVAYFAHIGGFVFGLAAIKLFADRYREGRVGHA
jgi:membrane associated rhomboid family serine protease